MCIYKYVVNDARVDILQLTHVHSSAAVGTAARRAVALAVSVVGSSWSHEVLRAEQAVVRTR
jgi:hypothetical protein